MPLLNRKRKITLWTRIAYGSANLIGSGASNIGNAWLLFFLTAFGNIPVWEASIIFVIVSWMDVIMNPIIGYISDNLYSTKIGRLLGRRRFFILAAMPLMVIYSFIWTSGMSFWYYLILYLLFEFGYDLFMVPYETLATEMTQDFKERTYLTGARALFGNIANFLTGALPGIYFMLLGKDSPYAFLATGGTWAAVMLSVLILVYFNSWERNPEEVPNEQAGSLLEGIKKLFIDTLSTFKIRAFRLHLGNYLFGAQGALVVFTTVFTYYIIYALNQQPTLVSAMNSLNSILQIITTFTFVFICSKKGFIKPNLVALTLVVLSVLSYGALYLLDAPDTTLYFAVIGITVVMGVAMGGTYYIPWTVYAFMADIDELVTNRRREGVLAGSMMVCNKFLKAVLLLAIGNILSAFGFKAGSNVLQPDSAIYAITLLMVAGTVVFVLIAVYCTCKFKVFNQETYGVIIEEVKRVHNGGRIEDVLLKNRKICELLTGYKYENCFGNNNVGYKGKENQFPKHKESVK